MILESYALIHTPNCPLYIAYPNDERKTCLIKVSVLFGFAAHDTLGIWCDFLLFRFACHFFLCFYLVYIEGLGGFSSSSDGKASACKQEIWAQSRGQEDPLEKEMATHSSILHWRIPWTEQPGELQSMPLQTVELNWATNTHTHGYRSFMPLLVFILVT